MSLSKRLREAAIERFREETEPAEDCVLEDDGVIDLRALEREQWRPSGADPAVALAETKGRVAEAAAVDSLYYEEQRSTRRWRLGRKGVRSSDEHEREDSGDVEASRSTTTVADTTRPSEGLTRLSALPLSHGTETIDLSEPTPGTETIDLSEPTPGTETIDLSEPTPGTETIDLSEPTAAVAPPVEADAGPDPVDAAPPSSPRRECPKCAATGRRDLVDPFNQLEYLSCDNCHNMWQVERNQS